MLIIFIFLSLFPENLSLSLIFVLLLTVYSLLKDIVSVNDIGQKITVFINKFKNSYGVTIIFSLTFLSMLLSCLSYWIPFYLFSWNGFACYFIFTSNSFVLRNFFDSGEKLFEISYSFL